MAGRGSIGVLTAAVALLGLPAGAGAGPTTPYPGCTQLQITMGTCSGPALPPASGSGDPGGSETVAQPVPKRYYGFLREAFTPKPAYCTFVARSGHNYAGC